MGGKVISGEMEFTNNGINLTNKIEGDGVTFSQIYKKMN